MRLAHNISYIKGLASVVQKEVLHINDSDNIIRVFLVNGKTGKLIFPENLNQLIVGVVYIGKCYMYSGYHNILGIGISQVEYIVDHLLFIRLDDSIFMAYINNCTQIFLCHCLIGGSSPPELFVPESP